MASTAHPSSQIRSTNPSSQSPTTPSASTDNSAFRYPAHTTFPPFYTLQPNLTTRASQLSSWSSLICSYCSHHRLFKLTPSHPIFSNKSINRTLPPDDARSVLQYMVDNNRAEWLDSPSSTKKGKGERNKEETYIYFRTPSEWAAAIQSYVESTGQRNAVVTFYELVEGDETKRESFWGLPLLMCKRAVSVLVGRGRAAVFGDGEGVKFFL